MEKGYIGAQVNLGTMYAYGVGVEQDYAKAAEWFKKATEQGNAGADFKESHVQGWNFQIAGIAKEPV